MKDTNTKSENFLTTKIALWCTQAIYKSNIIATSSLVNELKSTENISTCCYAYSHSDNITDITYKPTPSIPSNTYSILLRGITKKNF